jgi:periplasmic protein TonB
MSRSASFAPRQRVIVVVSLIVLAAIGAGAYFWSTGSVPGVAAVGGPASASSSGGKDDSGVGIMLDLAKTAVGEKRLVAPAGSNAYEFYLSVLQLDPQNKLAQDQLHDSFEAASADVERAINDNDLDEAQRELSLLREFDSTNYILSLLGGKLDAQRQIQVRKDEARAAVIQAQQSAGNGSML